MTHVETDVHATRDGVVVAFHDAVLDRVSDGHGAIADLTWADLQTVRVGGSQVVPRLADLLDTWPDLRVNIDVKAWPAVSRWPTVVDAAAARHRVCVTSFDDRRSAAVRALLGPEVATSPGKRGVTRWRFASWLPGLARRSGWPGRPARASSPTRSRRPPVRCGWSRGGPWTSRTGWACRCTCGRSTRRSEMHRLLDLGVDGLITDRSDTLRDVLRDRGAARA